MDFAPAAHRFDQATLGRLGFGASTLGNLYRPMNDDAAAATVRAALDAGIAYFDVAPHYGFGLAEKRLGAALAAADPRRSEEHTSELTSLMRISSAVFLLKNKKKPHEKK